MVGLSISLPSYSDFYNSVCEFVAPLKDASELTTPWFENSKDPIVRNSGIIGENSFNKSKANIYSPKDSLKEKVDKANKYITEVNKICAILNTKDEALAWFSTMEYLLKKTGPLGEFYAKEVKIGKDIIKIAYDISSLHTGVYLDAGAVVINVYVSGESCGFGGWSPCTWTKNDIEKKVIKEVVIVNYDQSRNEMNVNFSSNKQFSLYGDTIKSMPFEFYDIDNGKDNFVRVTTKDDQKIYIPLQDKYLENDGNGSKSLKLLYKDNLTVVLKNNQ